ncbi:MAG: pseudouridine synthase [bacterium]|nr:pseudouridine synthase [bacterium]
MRQRLQKILAAAGAGSRRSCEALIRAGRVRVNGLTVTALGSAADPAADVITLDGRRIGAEEKVYVVLNKPRGVLCTRRDPRRRPTVYGLLAEVPQRLFTVGRLDFDAEGLIVLTNDGAFAERVAHPRGEVWKTYILRTAAPLAAAARARIERGIPIDGRMTLPARVVEARAAAGGGTVTVRIREGRKRQLKRMFAAVGCPVLALRRTAIGGLRLGGLPPGSFRVVSREHLEKMFER